jgi:hypothetical protein
LNGLIVGVIGSALVGAFFYARAKRERVPVYAVLSQNFVGDLPSLGPLKVYYGSERIKNVTATQVWFWNQGRQTIVAKDGIVKPLAIRPKPGLRILDARILRDNNEHSNFKVTRKRDGSQAKIQFKYVEKGQGVLVQVVHDGEGSRDLEVTGVFLEARKLSRKEVNAATITGRTGRMLAVVGAFVLFGFFVALALANNDVNGALGPGLMEVFLVIVVVTGLKSTVPKGLGTLEGLLIASGPDYLKNIRSWGKRLMSRASPPSQVSRINQGKARTTDSRT